MDKKRIFVVHGRNIKLMNAMVEFLRSVGLDPLEWDEAKHLTGKATPYIGEILDTAFSTTQAVVVMFTPDDEAKLRDGFIKEDDKAHEKELTPQPRLNVIYEAGMAMGKFPGRTVIVEFGHNLRLYSDIAGIHTIRMDNTPTKRQNLISALKNAGVEIGDLTGRTGWYTAGDFTLEEIEPVNKPSNGGVFPDKNNEPVNLDRTYNLNNANIFHYPPGCRTSSLLIKRKLLNSLCIYVNYDGSNLPDFAGAYIGLDYENWERVHATGALLFDIEYKGELNGNTINVEFKAGHNKEVIGSYGVEIINSKMRVRIPLRDVITDAAKICKMAEIVFLFNQGLFNGNAEIEIKNLLLKTS